jgi:hypothetical protein
MKKLNAALVVASLGAFAAVPAHAALDEAVTTAINLATTNMGLLYSALTAAGVTIWVARMISARFKVR